MLRRNWVAPSATSRVAGRAMLTSALLSVCLVACAPAPEPMQEAAQPVVQGNQLRFPANHPQLALLAMAKAEPSKGVTIELPARLVWNEERTQRVFPAFSGRVTAIRADVGQQVKQGSTLAQLASPDFGVAQADTAKAQADLRMTQKTLQRQKELLDAGIIARKDYEQAETDSERAKAEAARAVARTQLYGSASVVNQQLGITAGLNGIVVERNVNPGQEVRPDQSGPGMPALFVITDPTKLWVQIDARESEVGTLRPGSSFTLVVPSLGGKRFEGTVVAASDAIDPSTRTIKIRGVVSNPERLLKAEMLATAQIERQLGAGVMIPSGAVWLSGTTHHVFVQTSAGNFEKREVRLSYEGPREVVVQRGLEVGEMVVSDNLLLLAREFRLAAEEAKSAEAAKPKAAENATPTPKAGKL
jgi:membrane fusion protein, heavy metal efflux system